jgi:hypothetical protein
MKLTPAQEGSQRAEHYDSRLIAAVMLCLLRNQARRRVTALKH